MTVRDFNPYDVDIDTIKESRRITDEWEILKYKVSAKINDVFDTLTTEEIVEKTGLNRSDISRIRIQSIKRFSLDRLVKILCQLGKSVSLTVKDKKDVS